MSNTYYETNKISLTAFVGKEGERNSLQITMPYGKEYTCLNQKEMIELANNILLRANSKISATGCEKGIYLNTESIEAFKEYIKNHKDINLFLAVDILEEFEDCFKEV